MTIGPVERFMARIQQLEAALGVRPAAEARRTSRKKGRLGPGGRKLLGMLRRRELDHAEMDMLGEALLYEGRANYRKAQELLDLLSYAHRLRIQAERANCAKTVTAEVAGMGQENGAKD